MKKFIVVLVTMFTTLVGAEVALANVHTGFSVTTEACGSCHVTHAASAAKLLKFGGTQTAFCYGCHDEARAGSPYDVESGRTTDATGTGFVVSYSGAFDFASANYAGTSRHDVENLTTPGTDLTAAQIPGNSTALGLTGGLRCGSCHDPHGDNTTNGRLLRGTLLGTNVNISVYFPLDADHRPTSYDIKINQWCAGCHGKFNRTAGSGHTADGYGMYRHAMGVSLAALPTDYSMATGTPVANFNATPAAGKNQLVCLSCHRAHGTDKVSTTSWNRDGGGSSSSTALLRMSNRGVCYNCHGAASQNGSGL
ncbi:cytochrome c3 family protein [Carboxydocella sp. ULO1]|uniref:cytochrome c3 family protein n=1 Tax=Carboxydocella sp. ULO1 TaxID=1926599 RepID=UPI0013562FBB|nr:cytochrome c3 family protein [Carboxydocella sp. ULO1]